MSEHGGAELRRLMAAGPVLLPGCYDGLTAALFERAGFSALALSGAGAAASVLGVPDLGLLTLPELVTVARHITARTRIPLLVDADTGFGNVLNVVRTVAELAAAGAAAVQIEDQTFPKRCGHLDGKSVVERGEYVEKIRAADRARAGADTLLVARTDALAVVGIDEAIARANAAVDAGADVAFVEAPTDLAQVEQIASGVAGPKMYNLATGGRSPALAVDELGQLGFQLVVMPALALLPVMHAVTAAAKDALRTRTDAHVAALGLRIQDLYDALGFAEWDAITRELVS